MKVNTPYSQYFSSSWFCQGFGETFHQVSKIVSPIILVLEIYLCAFRKIQAAILVFDSGFVCPILCTVLSIVLFLIVEFSNRMHVHDGVLGGDDEVNV
jgi:hypothetical protein